MSDQIESLDEMRRQLAWAGSRREWEALIVQAQRIRAAYPQSEDADYYEARGLIESGRYEDAEHVLLLGMDRFPRNPMLAVLYGESGTRSLGRDDAIDRWQSILVRLPEIPNVYLGLAHAYRSSGRADDADRVIAAGLERMPDNEELLVNRAQSAWQRQDWAVALRDWSTVQTIAPRRPDALTFRIRALARLGRCDEADALARDGFTQRPADVELAVSYAMTAMAAGAHQEAVQRWRRALEVGPSYVYAAFGLSQAFSALGRFEEALAAVRQGLTHNPASDVLLKEIAVITEKLFPDPPVEVSATATEAVAAWKVTYDQAPPKAATYLGYAAALEQAGRLELADEILSEGVGFAPDHKVLRMKHAAIAATRGDHPEALRRWQAAEQLFPDAPAIAKGVRAAERGVEKEQKVLAQDAAHDVEDRKSSIAQPVVREGTRVPQIGPTALDLLLTGAPVGAMAIKPAPAPTGFAAMRAKLGRIFGRD